MRENARFSQPGDCGAASRRHLGRELPKAVGSRWPARELPLARLRRRGHRLGQERCGRVFRQDCVEHAQQILRVHTAVAVGIKVLVGIRDVVGGGVVREIQPRAGR